ncbi:TatD family hydrolase [Sinimarinibacterium thermocellulolyticum]|uniref:TatD family hydrolase n=1 Tax=Sinimarinibacterium thermocellulolyticum TaxID=3170016 RepID=A0ABV2A8T7_9GAMM
MALIDIGANLAHDSFDADRDAVLERAAAAGVVQIVVTGSSFDSNAAALELARAHPGRLYATAGLHPHHARDWDARIAEQLREHSAQPQVVALGECGLDYFRDYSPREVQRRVFAAQLDIAAQAQRPLFLHQRDAHSDFLAMLREYRAQLGAVVVHCFTDTQAALEDYLALDCHIGITGWICDERRGKHLVDAVRIIPDERLMVETDAPYLLPRTAPKTSHRRNEPAHLVWVVRALAAARGVTETALAAATTRTARAFFGLPCVSGV